MDLYTRRRTASHRARFDVRDLANAATMISQISGKIPVTASQLLGWVVEEFVELLRMTLEAKGEPPKLALDEGSALRKLAELGLEIGCKAGKVDASRRLHEMILENRKLGLVRDEGLLGELQEGAQEAEVATSPETLQSKIKEEKDDGA